MAASKTDPSENLVSELRAIRPPVEGLRIVVVDQDRFLRLTNGSGSTVLVKGYDDEPYLRFKPDRSVEVNTRSPSKYVNEDRYGQTPVPAQAQSDATPKWQLVSRDGAYTWFDHRIHSMNKGTPPEVADPSKPAKVFDWRVAMEVDDRPVQAVGRLDWRPQEASSADDGISVPLIAALAAGTAALVAGALVLLRRRRGGTPEPGREKAAEEAW